MQHRELRPNDSPNKKTDHRPGGDNPLSLDRQNPNDSSTSDLRVIPETDDSFARLFGLREGSESVHDHLEMKLPNGCLVGSVIDVMMNFGSDWNATREEIDGSVVGDDVCSDARMGFGRAGWYSYDWIDNLGRRSAMAIHPEWQDVVSGSPIPGGPVAFTAALVDPPRAFVLQFGKPGGLLCFTLAYELRDDPAGTRLVTRMRTSIRVPGGLVVERALLGPGDGFMVRRQLRGIAERAEANRLT